jgi:glucose dehydrogenase
MRSTPIRPLGAAVLLLVSSLASAQQGATDGEWRAFAGDLGSTKYSALDQITADNVDELQVAWRRPIVDASYRAMDANLSYSNVSTAAPLVVDGVGYVPNAIGLVEAFDIETGETRWTQSPFGGADDLRGAGTRGVAYWSDGADARILAQRGEYLYALHPDTGARFDDFGDGGRVHLTIGLAEGARYRWGGAPTVVRDVVVLGQSMTDTFETKEAIRGDVRAFDVRTGELRWVFHTVPQAGEFGTDTWADDSYAFSGHAPVWSLFSADEELGYLYMPITSPTNDMYGGHRGGDNLYGQSIVCVDASTGERVWHFQTVHHGLWDYDPPTAPILMDLTVEGREVKAVVQLTKQAFAFAFDRVSGEPIWPIEERPVPQSATPGEATSLTQPFPTKPPAFDRQGATEENLIDFTPELRAEALAITQRYVIGPMFTPPSIKGDGPNAKQGTIQLPGSQGGADVQGAAFDPETGYLFIPSITSPFVADITEGNPDRTNLDFVKGSRQWIGGPQGLPLFKPPYGRITAIDMNRGEIVWMTPNGDGPRNHPAIRHLELGPLGVPGRPGPLVTKTLLFLGEGSTNLPGGARVPDGMPPEIVTNYGGRMFRAYDKATGAVVWETELAAGTIAPPITYMAGGKQYLQVSVGDTNTPGETIAFTLP